MSKPAVSIIVPVYNEAEVLGGDLDLIKETMDKAKINYELIVVDDGSTDNSAEVARQKGVKLIQHKKNRGVGAARKTGILTSSADIVITTDGDGTYPNQEMPKLLKLMDEYDMVIGARTGQNVHVSVIRWLPKYLIGMLASYLSKAYIPDLNSGLRVFKKGIALKYFYLLPDSHSWESTITLAFLCNKHNVRFEPVDYYKRKGGKSSFHPLKDTINYISLTIRTVMYFNPIRIFGPVSIVLFLGGLAKMIYDFVRFNGDIGEFGVMVVIIAILVGFMGLLADLIVIQHKK